MGTIYLDAGLAKPTKKWFIADAPNSGDGNHPCETMAGSTAVSVVDTAKTSSPDPPHRPWLVPGVGKL